MGLPDIQNLVNKAVSLIRERELDIEVLRQNAKYAGGGEGKENRGRRKSQRGDRERQVRCISSNSLCSADVKRAVEMGKCEVLLKRRNKKEQLQY